MTAYSQTVAFVGVETTAIDVQVRLANGLPAFIVVGLPDKAVAESRERVRAALGACGLALPTKRVVINLAPADITKSGSHYDLPIALGLLAAMNVIPVDVAAGYCSLGELALDGGLRPVPGVLVAALAAHDRGLGLICPRDNGGEAAWAEEDLDIVAAAHLTELIAHLTGTQSLPRPQRQQEDSTTNEILPDLADIKGQETAKRALEIAAAGGHNLLLIGPPGAGKSMLAARLPGLLPPLDAQAAREASMVHSIAGQLHGGLLRRPPFRNPHHSASPVALVGGGHKVAPGEITLAHRGVLFLDELAEFPRTALEALRQPIESGETLIARANAHIRYPARFQLIAAMNPCFCGHLDDPDRVCPQAPRCAADYQSRVSGPLFDRIDLYVEMPAVRASDLDLPPPAENSTTVAARAAQARQRQFERYKKIGSTARINAEIEGRLLDDVTVLDQESRNLLSQAVETFGLSARGHARVRRVARSIADLSGAEKISRNHIAEALSYRRMTHDLPRRMLTRR